MNQKIFKQFGVLLSFLLVFTQMSFAQPLTMHAKTLEETVTISAIDNEQNEIINSQEVEFEKGDTAWDVLGEVADDLKYDESEQGKMLQSINGVEADFDKDGTYWEFYVNDTFAEVGIGSYELQNEDVILIQQSAPETTTDTVTISALDNEDNEVIKSQEVEFEKGDTAWDVLGEVADDLKYDESEQGKMLLGINGVVTDYDKDGTYWEFYVNNDYAEVGLASYQLKDEDVILLQQSPPEIATSAVTISALDNKDNEIIKLQQVDFEDGDTAWDVLDKVADDLKYEEFDFGKLLLGINGITTDFDKDGTYWEFYVNNNYADVGIDGYILNDEDVILIQQSSPTVNETEDNDTETPEKGSLESVKINKLSKKDIEKIETDLDILTNKVLNNGLATDYGGEWWVWGLGIAGKKAPSSYKKNIEKTIKETKGDLGAVTELEKVIIALSSQGYDATNIAGYNLIEILENHEGLTQSVTSAIYALIAFNSGNYEVDADVEKQVLQYILENEIPNGGWNYAGNDISVDITGMALIALGYYQDNDNVKVKIDRAVTELSKAQHDNGGFHEKYNGGYTSESASQAIMGLISVGVDPTGELFTKKEANLVEYLLTFRTADGYLHTLKDKEPGPFPDQQALLALGFINNHVEKQDTDNGQGSPDKDKDSDKDEDSNKGEGQSKVTVTQNTKTPVKATQTVQVKGTKISVKMPKDLPSNAQIKVKKLEKVESGSLKVAGDIVEIDVVDANGKPIKGEFTLTLAIDEALIGEDVSIYYFDEETNTWKYVGGTVNDDGTISANVNHFSKYGVFLTAERDKKKVVEEEEESDPMTKSTEDEDGKKQSDVEVKTDGDDGSIKVDNTEKELPNTANNMFNFIAIGLFISLIGGTLLFIQRKRTNQS